MIHLKYNLKKLSTFPTLLLFLINSHNTHADFLQDSKSVINFKNFYMERDYEENSRPTQGSWSQGITGRFESGYTDTQIQVGLDALAQYAVRLNDHHAETKNNILPYDEEKKRLDRSYGKLGLTLKLKYQDTELKIGELEPKTPVIHNDETRQLYTVFSGAILENKSFDDLKISTGFINRVNARYDDHYRKLGLKSDTWENRNTSDGLMFVGFDYKVTPDILGSYWYGELIDIYRQQYTQLAYNTKIDKVAFKIDGQYFNNKEAGAALDGKIDSQSYGVRTTFESNGHTLTTGIKKNEGPSVFPTMAGNVPQRFLHAWSNLGFTKPNERTWHILYRYDFKTLGIDGLTTTVRYMRGDRIHRPGLIDNKENEQIYTLRYTVPEGRFKNVGIELIHIATDIKYGKGIEPGNKFNENRFSLSYLYKF